MAVQAAIGNRADRFVHAILTEIDDLPRIAATWPELADWQQADVLLEWDHLTFDYLAELEEQYQSGAMAEPQRAQYRKLLARLQSALPVIEALRLQVPDVALDKSADATLR